MKLMKETDGRAFLLGGQVVSKFFPRDLHGLQPFMGFMVICALERCSAVQGSDELLVRAG
jgi:hypothetical protein